MHQKRPVVLMILDGWGYQKTKAYNAIATANTPQWDKWWHSQPHVLLDASGSEVGLPDFQMGNSEVGHMHIGAGRRIYQDFTRINKAISSGEFFKNPVFINTLNTLKANNKKLHVMGLFSPGGVHSHEDHLLAFLDLCHQEQFDNVCLHLFLDGRDTPPQSALQSIIRLNHYLEVHPVAKITSISGRYFAMDRDNRWERIAPVYRLLTEKHDEQPFTTATTAVESFYAQNIHDEFIPPTAIAINQPMEDGDALFFFNFRADRARQLTQAFLKEDFTGFLRHHRPRLSHVISMTEYAHDLPTECAYSTPSLQNTLGEVLSGEGLSQLRIAETEKYAHVTFFFNGGSESPFPNENRILIPSPLVATYDLIPEMSAPELTRVLIEAIDSNLYDVIICNYANADMVGHTGNFDATVEAIECLDQCMSMVWDALAQKNGALFITADHGNAEAMFDEAIHQPHTAHTCEPVPFLYVGGNWHFKTLKGSLIDIAPTLLAFLGIKQPDEMTGNSLLVEDNVDDN